MGTILHFAVPHGSGGAMGTPEERLMPSQASSTVFQHLQGVLPRVISPGPITGPRLWHVSGQRGRKGIPAGRKAAEYLQRLGEDCPDPLAS